MSDVLYLRSNLHLTLARFFFDIELVDGIDCVNDEKILLNNLKVDLITVNSNFYYFLFALPMPGMRSKHKVSIEGEFFFPHPSYLTARTWLKIWNPKATSIAWMVFFGNFWPTFLGKNSLRRVQRSGLQRLLFFFHVFNCQPSQQQEAFKTFLFNLFHYWYIFIFEYTTLK